jgi:heme exporter protein B
MWAAFLSVVRRDLLLAFRHRSQIAHPILFFALVASLFPLGISPETRILSTLAPGIIWVTALLASLLSLDQIFRSDFEDGALEQLLISPHPTSFLILAKILAHWIVTGLPLVVVAPLLALAVALPASGLPTLVITLALGTPILSLIGAIGVALTVGLRRAGGLLSLLVLPLYVPVLIFGANAVDAAASGLPASGQIYVLGALLALALSLAPVTAAAALRISVN